MGNLRTYIMTVEEQRDFDPAQFTQNLKEAGFRFDSGRCPVKLTEPWDRVDAGNGAVAYRQWDRANTDAFGDRLAAEILAEFEAATGRPFRFQGRRPRSDEQADFDSYRQENGEGGL